MTKEKSIKDWQRLYNRLKDPDARDKARRETEKLKRLEEKRSDTGL